jgi:hypothetical protein
MRLDKTLPKKQAMEGVKNKMKCQPVEITSIWCDKRKYRLSLLICVHKKCPHLKGKDGFLNCKYVSKSQKELKNREDLK